MGIGPHLMGEVNQEMIDWLNDWQPDEIFLLGSGQGLVDLLDRLNYTPKAAILRLWFERVLDTPEGVKHITPDTWNDMLPWARATSEYQQHRNHETGQVYRPEFPAQWAEHWPPGTNVERKCVQKFIDWIRPDLMAVVGRPNVYVMSFIPGLAGHQIVPEFFTFEAERAAAMWDGGLTQPHHVKSCVLNFATGQYAPDKVHLWQSPQFGFFASVMRAYPQTAIGLHAYCHMSMKCEHGDMTVRDGSGLFPEHPMNYILDETGEYDAAVYPPSMLNTWAAFLPHKVYEEVLRPAGVTNPIFITESGWDRIYAPAWPVMVQEYYRGMEPAGFWEYATDFHNPGHWDYLSFLVPFMELANNNPIAAAQWFAAYDLAWAQLQDEQYPEIAARIIFAARTDGNEGWANFNIHNAHIFPDRFDAALADLRGGAPPPPPPDPDPDPDPPPDPDPDPPPPPDPGPDPDLDRFIEMWRDWQLTETNISAYRTRQSRRFNDRWGLE